MTFRRRPPSDGTLIGACRRGDERAWEALILRYRRLIYSLPAAYGLAPDQADEVFQAVAVRLYEQLGRIRRVNSLAAWLAVTARRECQALGRRARRQEPLEASPEPATQPAGITALHRVECEHALALAFERLGEPCRTLLSALYLEQPTPSYGEIARRLARPVGSLGPTRARCLRKLRELYLELGGPEP